MVQRTGITPRQRRRGTRRANRQPGRIRDAGTVSGSRSRTSAIALRPARDHEGQRRAAALIAGYVSVILSNGSVVGEAARCPAVGLRRAPVVPGNSDAVCPFLAQSEEDDVKSRRAARPSRQPGCEQVVNTPAAAASRSGTIGRHAVHVPRGRPAPCSATSSPRGDSCSTDHRPGTHARRRSTLLHARPVDLVVPGADRPAASYSSRGVLPPASAIENRPPWSGDPRAYPDAAGDPLGGNGFLLTAGGALAKRHDQAPNTEHGYGRCQRGRRGP